MTVTVKMAENTLTKVITNTWVRALIISAGYEVLVQLIQELHLVDSSWARILVRLLIGVRLVILASPLAASLPKTEDSPRAQ